MKITTDKSILTIAKIREALTGQDELLKGFDAIVEKAWMYDELCK